MLPVIATGTWTATREGSPLIGTWKFGSSLCNINATEFGQLRLSQQLWPGGEVFGTLRPEGDWFIAEVRFADGDLLGTIRVRFIEEQSTMASNFKGPEENTWSQVTVATKVSTSLE